MKSEGGLRNPSSLRSGSSRGQSGSKLPHSKAPAPPPIIWATLTPRSPHLVSLCEKRGLYGNTRKGTLLESVPWGVTTLTLPVVAPAGTVVVISELETALKTSRRAVKRDAGRARQIGPQNLDGRSHLAGGRLRFHKRPETHGEAEDRAIAVGPARSRCPVEGPVGVLDQPRVGLLAVRAVETVQRPQRAAWGDFEDRATAKRAGVGRPAEVRCPVEGPIGVLDQTRVGLLAVRAVESCAASSACRLG